MSILCFSNKDNIIHIMYRQDKNKIVALCDVRNNKEYTLITLSASHPFNGLCKKCLNYYDRYYHPSDATLYFNVLQNATVVSYKRLSDAYHYAKNQDWFRKFLKILK